MKEKMKNKPEGYITWEELGIDNDVSRELKAFLDYVAGKESDDFFVKKLKNAVMEAKKNREWRHEYMTLLMRDQENMEKGIIYGAIAAYRDFSVSDIEIIKKLQTKFHLSHEEAAQDILDSNM